MLFGVLTRLLSYVRKHIHWFCCPHCLTHTFDLRATNHHRPHRISSVRDNRAMCYTTCPGTQDRSQALPVQARERERLPRRSVSVYLKCPFVFFCGVQVMSIWQTVAFLVRCGTNRPFLHFFTDELGVNKDRYKSLADEMDSTFAELAGY